MIIYFLLNLLGVKLVSKTIQVFSAQFYNICTFCCACTNLSQVFVSTTYHPYALLFPTPPSATNTKVFSVSMSSSFMFFAQSHTPLPVVHQVLPHLCEPALYLPH